MTGSGIHVPKDGTEVTPEWIADALTSILKAKSAKVTWFYAAAHQEAGYLSSIFRAKVEVAFSEKRTEQHKVFIKIMPADDVHKGLVAGSFMDVTEVETYRTLFTDLVAFEREVNPSSPSDAGIASVLPRMYAGDYCRDPDRRAFFVMLEDIAPEYEMPDFGTGLPLDQLAASLRALARFHATCYAYGRVRGVDFGQKYGSFLSTFFEKFESDKELEDFMDHNMDLVEKDLKGSPNEDLLPSVQRLRKGIGRKYRMALQGDGYKKFIMHGDIWANNLLFGPGGSCKIVDWQFTALGCVYLDFGTTALISMSPADTAAHEAELFDAYHSEFTSVCSRLGGVAAPWTREEFGRTAREEGLFLAFLWCSTSYELVEKYPALKDRVHWLLRESVKTSPKRYG